MPLRAMQGKLSLMLAMVLEARTFRPRPQVHQPSACAVQSDPKGPHCMGLQLLLDHTQGWPLAARHI